MTRNYFVKRWILEALVSQPTPLSAKGTLEVIKTNRSKKTTSRRSPNLSPIKLATIMIRMPEIEYMPGLNHAQPHVYWLKRISRTQGGPVRIAQHHARLCKGGSLPTAPTYSREVIE